MFNLCHGFQYCIDLRGVIMYAGDVQLNCVAKGSCLLARISFIALYSSLFRRCNAMTSADIELPLEDS